VRGADDGQAHDALHAGADHVALEARLLAEPSDGDQDQLADLFRQLLISLGDHAPDHRAAQT
jgi:hypothetical protein